MIGVYQQKPKDRLLIHRASALALMLKPVAMIDFIL
jgi:hypothetical protein